MFVQEISGLEIVLAKHETITYLQYRGTQPQIGPIVYRLGRQVFILESRVRLPVGLQNY